MSGRATLLLLAACAGACRTTEEGTPRAEFGVLYGGDIQDRKQFVLELDRSKQELGLRVTFEQPVRRPLRVSWEIERPSTVRGLDGGFARAAEIGAVTLNAGERRADAAFAFRAGDPPGEWRIVILVEGARVLDRSFEVVRPNERPRAPR
jgi:hypothetical protein